MITEKVGNLLEAKDVDVAAHCCNLFCTFGHGIAYAIKNKFPEAYEADLKTEKGSKDKLGTYSIGRIKDQKGTSIKHIVNLYAMTGIGAGERQTSYDALEVALTRLHNLLKKHYNKGLKLNLGMPYKMGSDLAGGSWTIVRAIIESVFADSPIQVYIYYLPEFTGEMK